MNNLAQFFDNLVNGFNKGRDSHEFTLARIIFIGEIRMRTSRVIVGTEVGTKNQYPLWDLNNLLRSFGVILSRRHVHGTSRSYIYAIPINPTFPARALAAPADPVMPLVLDRECLACGGTGEMEASWSAIPGPEALPSHECFVCNGERVVHVCSGCNHQIEAGEACACLKAPRLAVAA